MKRQTINSSATLELYGKPRSHTSSAAAPAGGAFATSVSYPVSSGEIAREEKPVPVLLGCTGGDHHAM